MNCERGLIIIHAKIRGKYVFLVNGYYTGLSERKIPSARNKGKNAERWRQVGNTNRRRLTMNRWEG